MAGDEPLKSTDSLPHLRHGEHGIQLIVKGKPFLMLAGELHNSSLSSARYMEEVWPAMRAQSINTLLGAVTWEMIEPEEGRFDFAELDAVLIGARRHGMRLVLLWFGTWKNGISTYVPGWVKRDVKRFPRVHVLEAGGVKRTLEMISPLSEECCRADARAFAKLMAHLKEVDSEDNTVVMVQVENETGLLGDSRDRSATAMAKFREPVPAPLLEYLTKAELHPRMLERFGHRLPKSDQIAGSSHSWEDVFGPGAAADEAFMAYHISAYVGRVAAAGRAAYPIPLYANTWLNFDDPAALDLRDLPVVVGGGAKPGYYPSGGPCPHVQDIWRFNAPSLDFLAPDLYFHDYEGVCRDYTAHTDNALFIPEQRRDENGSRRVWLAYATYGALGCAPFGIDTGADVVGREYKLLEQTKEYLLSSTSEQRFGFFFDEKPEGNNNSNRGKETWTKVLGDVEVIVERAFVFGKPGPGAGMIIQLGDIKSTKFLCVGRGFQVRFRSLVAGATFTGLLHAEEKEFDPSTGELRTLRTLNGDETRSGEFLIMPNDDPDYGGFPIAVTIPARTCIAELEAYWVCEDEEDL
ncbi:beta-galactosidase [Xylariales sp. PMI_506]|nr:beta-galactosidase [Xylariales sp. PMI_506]